MPNSIGELNAPELVKKWKTIVNDNVQMGRDSHLMKEALFQYTPVQILLGIYRYKGQNTVTIPQFLRQPDKWLEADEYWAQVELACAISHTTPPEYYVYQENADSYTTDYYQHAMHAKQQLQEWAQGILA